MRVLLKVLVLLTTSAPGWSTTVVTAVNSRDPNARSWFSVGAGIGIDGDIYDNRIAQSFLATATGTLQDVAFGAYIFSTEVPTVPLRVDVTALSGGQPGAILATTYVPVEQFVTEPVRTPAFNVTADFAGSTLELQVGTMYALVFRTDTTNANYRLVGGYDEPFYGVPGYQAGMAFKSQNSSYFEPSATADMYFRVQVDAVPEPSSGVLLTCGGMVLTARRRSRISRAAIK